MFMYTHGHYNYVGDLLKTWTVLKPLDGFKASRPVSKRA